MAVNLSPRELEVAALVAEGWPQKRIAAHLRISRGTVATLVFRIAIKIGAPDDAVPSVVIARWWGRTRDVA